MLLGDLYSRGFIESQRNGRVRRQRRDLLRFRGYNTLRYSNTVVEHSIIEGKFHTLSANIIIGDMRAQEVPVTVISSTRVQRLRCSVCGAVCPCTEKKVQGSPTMRRVMHTTCWRLNGVFLSRLILKNEIFNP